MTSIETDAESAGFTLLEFAIVLVVAGLLTGSILKGQEMVRSAQLVSTGAAMDELAAARQAFIAKYGAAPGDYAAANAVLGSKAGLRWPACDGVAACDGDGVVGNRDERMLFAQHLAAADLIRGVELAPAPRWADWTNGQYPRAPSGGGVIVGHDDWSVGAEQAFFVETARLEGVGRPFGPFDGVELERLDRKFDDARPLSGGVRALPTAEHGCFTQDGPWRVNASYDIAAEHCSVAFLFE